MQYILTASQMKNADAYTIQKKGIESLTLMERAATAVIKQIMKHVEPGKKPVLIVCGTGNNGGDGLAVARLLSERSYRVYPVLVGDPGKMTEETKVQFHRLIDRKIAVHEEMPTENSDSFSCVVDALFGIGLTRSLSGKFYDAVQNMNTYSCYKLAVDIPSGISADNGQVLGVSFHADETVTMAYAKIGHYLYPGKDDTGTLHIADIGIYGEETARKYYMTSFSFSDLKQVMPTRPTNSHKGTFGRVLCICGSDGMAGAAYLSALSAYRIGAGLVEIYTDEKNRIPLQTLLPEAILTTYNSEEVALPIEQLQASIERASVIVMGSGLGMSVYSKLLVPYVLKYADCPVVVDADGINILAQIDFPTETQIPALILTPHMKEMSRLSGFDVTSIKEDPVSFGKAYFDQLPDSVKQRVTLVLKDAVTLVFSGKDKLWLNTHGSAVMAKGGSGDVLAGVIGGLLAQHTPVETAAALGVYLHSLAGEKLEEKSGAYGGLAHEIAEQLPYITVEK